MAKKTTDKNNLQSNLERLTKIKEWFDSQEELDLEEGLKMVKEAGDLIKNSKEQLKGIENKFEEIKKSVEIDDEENKEDGEEDVVDVPF